MMGEASDQWSVVGCGNLHNNEDRLPPQAALDVHTQRSKLPEVLLNRSFAFRSGPASPAKVFIQLDAILARLAYAEICLAGAESLPLFRSKVRVQEEENTCAEEVVQASRCRINQRTG